MNLIILWDYKLSSPNSVRAKSLSQKIGEITILNLFFHKKASNMDSKQKWEKESISGMNSNENSKTLTNLHLTKKCTNKKSVVLKL